MTDGPNHLGFNQSALIKLVNHTTAALLSFIKKTGAVDSLLTHTKIHARLNQTKVMNCRFILHRYCCWCFSVGFVPGFIKQNLITKKKSSTNGGGARGSKFLKFMLDHVQ